ncbi:MAG: GGDEF domain-containing protein [Myxococcota bacterium]
MKILTGPEPGVRLPLSVGRHVFGRSNTADVRIVDPNLSRRHAEIIVTPQRRCLIRDLRSTNGTRVNGAAIRGGSHPLTDGDRIRLGRTLTLRLDNCGDRGKVSYDPMTGAYDRRYLARRVEDTVEAAVRAQRPLTMALLDVDQLARINDEHGPMIGDEVLRALSELFCEDASVMLSRLTADDFVLLLPDTTLHVAEARLAHQLAGFSVTEDDLHLPVSISVGMSCTTEGRASSVDLFMLASQRMRAAKQRGSGQICAA